MNKMVKMEIVLIKYSIANMKEITNIKKYRAHKYLLSQYEVIKMRNMLICRNNIHYIRKNWLKIIKKHCLF